jgi:hypothetical protein
MRKATMGLLVALCLCGATSWQRVLAPHVAPVAQWRVVKEQHVLGGTTPPNYVPIYTPTTNGFYRLSATCSVIGGQSGQSSWIFTFAWTEPGGNGGGFQLACSADNFQPIQQIVLVFTPKPGSPLVLNGSALGEASSYEGAYTIEELE